MSTENQKLKNPQKTKKKQNLKNRILFWLSMVLIISVAILIFSKVYEGVLPKLVESINNGAIAAILTAIITVLLLSQQSETEEVREKNSKVFERKLAIYDDFLKEIQSILESKKIDDWDQQRLIFQLALLKTHSKGENINKISLELNKIIRLLNTYGDEITIDHHKLAKYLFEIVGIFQEELYGERKGETDPTILIKNVAGIIKEIQEAKEKWSKTVFNDWEQYYKNQTEERNVSKEVMELMKSVIEKIKTEIDNEETYYLQYSPTQISFYLKNATKRNKIFLWLLPQTKTEVTIAILKEVEHNSTWTQNKTDKHIINKRISSIDDFDIDIIKNIKESYRVVKEMNEL